MAARLGVGAMGVQDRYLGLPSLISRSKSETFRFLEEKLLQKLQGWKQRHLSWAAKETLLKSVAAALPVYVMACFKLPVTLCHRLDKYMARFWWGGSTDRIHWMSWRKLCRSKQEGGLGFRRFEQFNHALLAKIGWRLIQDPDSLLARIYKGKYYPHGTLLEATARSRPSWGWQSVLHGVQLLKAGLRWQVGTGEEVEIMTANWVPGCHPHPPLVLPSAHLWEGATVDGLMEEEPGTWCDECLANCFTPETVRAIKSIVLPRARVRDKLVWHEDRSGRYSVKSGYHLAIRLNGSRWKGKCEPSWMDAALWRKLWSLGIQPKLKFFMWQVMSRILPTTEAFIVREIEVTEQCPVCWHEGEDLEHLFLQCPVARNLWADSGLEGIQVGLPGENMGIFLRRLLEKVTNEEVIMRLVSLLWRMWKSRNWMVFEGCQYTREVLRNQWMVQVEEWQRGTRIAEARSQTQGVRMPVDPERPPLGVSWVCSFDGAVSQASHSAVGIVLKGADGVVVSAVGKGWAGVMDPMLVELLALREAILWCRAMGGAWCLLPGGC
ncbi:unnamed protein product [Linum trigynum]|uniref:Reverse transcriptase zinc-binding domain-containing protein n=1 Tax=Linum trigynum TaxID=586398 RepID=A0AAV2GH04_9ROSI